jgi:hypothetical protein
VSEKSSDHRLAGAVEKFNRSKEQFDQLRTEMDAFFNEEPKPHSSLGEFDTDAWEWVERFQLREKPPLRFGIILGDCLHNLRSALDHTMWQVTLLDGGLPDDATQFPIASKSEDQFETMANRRIPGLSADHRAMVKEAQPYHAGHKAHIDPLSVLATLSNIDKHQVIHPTYSFIAGDVNEALDSLVGSYRGTGPSPVHKFWLAKEGSRMEHDTPWLRIEWKRGEEAPREVKVTGDMPLGISFGEIGLDARDFKVIAKTVLRIIQAFMRDFPETEFVEASG